MLIQGKLEDGTIFLDSTHEEFDFLPGRGDVPMGLQIAVLTMKPMEKIQLICGSKYGYNDRHRPSNVPKDSTLVMEVELVRFEKVMIE